MQIIKYIMICLCLLAGLSFRKQLTACIIDEKTLWVENENFQK
jgi:hypothetical protein